MNICFVSHTAATDGAEGALLEAIEALKNLNIQSFVLLPREGVLCDELSKSNVPFAVVPFSWWMGVRRSLRARLESALENLIALRPTIKKIREWNCQLVCTNTITIWVGALAAKLMGLPHVWLIQEFGWEDHGFSFDLGSRFSLGIVDRLSSQCAANSQAIAKYYSRFIDARKLRVIYYSMDRARSLHTRVGSEIGVPRQNGRFRCVITGRLSEGKGQAEALEALGELKREGLEIELLLIGRGESDYVERLRKIILSNGLDEQAIFLGRVDNPMPIVATADAVLTCSRSEAFGRVTLEGMLLGKPVIGARSGATPELVRDGFNGLLYTSGDHVDLANKLRLLFENPSNASLMGQNGRQWVETTFTGERYGRELCAMFAPLVVSMNGRASVA